MNRMHIHVSVEDLAKSTQFYTTLFGAAPSVEKHDYVKWSLDNPSVNFAISNKSSGREIGLNHLGIETDTEQSLGEISKRLKTAGEETFDEQGAQCCYALSEKTWVEDPSGLKWETFFSHGAITEYGEDLGENPAAANCCG